MHVHIGVVQVRANLAIGIDERTPVNSTIRWIHKLSLADGDASGRSPAIGEDPVVGDFQVMVPAVGEDSSAALRTVGEADAIDARWIAKEIAHESAIAESRRSSRASAATT